MVTESSKNLFDFSYYSLRCIALVYLLVSLPKSGDKIKAGDVGDDLDIYLKKREAYVQKLQKDFPGLGSLSSIALLLGFLPLEIKHCIDVLTQENDIVAKQVGSGKDQEFEIAMTLGAITGVTAESAKWSERLEGDKKPFVNGIAAVLTSLGSKMPEEMHRAVAQLAKYDGHKITADDAKEITELTDKIYKMFR